MSAKKVEKSASQGTAGSVSSHASKEKKKDDSSHHSKDKKNGVDGSSVSAVSVGVIKAPGGKKDAPELGRKGTLPASAAGDKDQKTEKGILKKKGRGKTGEVKKSAVKGKAKKIVKKKTFFEKIALSMGFYVGDVTLTDPWAIEAVQALDLQQWHLRRLKMRFDKIDLDGSGNIDYDEFFESIGEIRSPFTDKLFALIGECFRSVLLNSMFLLFFFFFLHLTNYNCTNR